MEDKFSISEIDGLNLINNSMKNILSVGISTNSNAEVEMLNRFEGVVVATTIDEKGLDGTRKIIEDNKDKNIIFTAHAYMHRHNRLLEKDDQFSITSYPGLEKNLEGNEIWKIFSKYENVVLGLSGHISNLDLSKFIDNNKTSLLFDNQDLDKKEQLGMIGLLTFKNNSDIVGVNWFSVNFNKLYRKENQFEIFVNHINCNSGDNNV